MGSVSIKLKRNVAAEHYRGHKGDVITIPEKEAMALVERNSAEYADSPREPEPEVKKEPEKKPAPKSRKKTAVAPQGDRVAVE